MSVAPAVHDGRVVSPFIGRSNEMGRLSALIGAPSVEPPPVAVLVGGEAGVGKTRLLSEFTSRAASAGFAVAVGHCVDLGDSPLPYLPFTQILGRTWSDSPAQAQSLVDRRPVLRRLMPVPSPGEDDRQSPAGDRAELFEAVAAAFVQMGASQPTIWVLEDVHWADRSTREMITYLLSHPPRERAHLIISYRVDDLHRRHPLRPVLGEWARLPGVERLTVPPLGDAEVIRLTQAIAPQQLYEPDLDAIVSRADGNPFFVEELVEAKLVGGQDLPSDLSDLLLVRVDSLDDDARAVVRAASVAGTEVSHRLLAQVLGVDEQQLEASLRKAVDANVIVPGSSDGYAFRHALLSEAVYRDLLPGERVRLHRAFTDAIIGDPRLAAASDLARHARGANDPVTALRASVRAGDEAMRLAAPDEALGQYESALTILSEPRSLLGADTGVDPIEVTIKAADAAMAAGHHLRALALAQEAVVTLPDGTAAEDRARLMIALAEYALILDSDVDPKATAIEALALLPGDTATPLRARLLGILARASGDVRREDAVTLATEALEMARQLGIPGVATDASTTIARLMRTSQGADVAAEQLRSAASQARATGEYETELRALYSQGMIYYEAGRLTDALEAYRAVVARSSELRMPWGPYAVSARAMMGVTQYVRGDWDEVCRMTGGQGETALAFPSVLIQSARLGVDAGRGDPSGLVRFQELVPWFDKDGMLAILASTAAIDLYGDRGSIAEAVAAHDLAVAAATRLWRTKTFWARIRLGALLIGQFTAQAAKVPPEDRIELFERGAVLVDFAEQAMANGAELDYRPGLEAEAWTQRLGAEYLSLRRVCGVDVPSDEEWLAAWEAAVERFGAWGHVFETARSQARLSRVLGLAAQDRLAREVREEAVAVARRLGAVPLLGELGTVALRPAHGLGGAPALTARELEVLTLIALGRSNREIAEELFISAKTASVHVSNILSKLGAQGRTEAVAISRREGLLE